MQMTLDSDALQPTKEDLRAAQRSDELHRVVHSGTFCKSPRLAALLTHICERTWAGHTDELSEQQIGIHFFHRQPGFNAGEDAIVRGSARHLRKRLDLYYQTEGRENPSRIHVPKGGYIASFEPYSPPVGQHNTVLQSNEQSVPVPSAATRLPKGWLVALSFCVCTLLGVAVYSFIHHSGSAPSEEVYGPYPLWSAMFQAGKRTVIVPGDTNLNLYTAYVHHAVPLHEYNEQQYQHDPRITAVSPEGPGDLTMIDATTMADTKLISELVRVPYRQKLAIADKSVEVRFARDLNEADLHGANLILLGSSTFNPWVSLFDRNLDFQLDRGFDHYTFRVLNRFPHPGEAAVINKTDEEVLTIVAFTEAIGDHEHVLLVEASRMGGIYSAEQFLFTNKLWQPVLNVATISGKLHDFEVVLASNFLKDEVSNTRVVALHVH